jgi:glycosyl hydrolase family 123
MHRWLILPIAAIPLVFSALRPAVPSFIWWTTLALDKVRPYDSPPQKLNDTVQISAARNEFESFQVVFHADSQQVDGIDLEVSDLTGPGGAVLPRSNISIYFERFMNLSKPSSIEGMAGEWPDPLIPRVDRYNGEKRNAFPFSVREKRNQPIWIEVYVPPSTRPGTYRGKVTVWIQQNRDATIPLTLNVWNFTLPSTSSLPNSFGFNGPTALRQHAGSYTTDEELRRLTFLYSKAALWHRLSLHGGAMIPPEFNFRGTNIRIDWTDYDAEVGPFLDGTVLTPGQPLAGAKITSIDLRESRDIQSDEQKILYWRAYAKHFREKGWLNRLFNYLVDEPKPEQFNDMLRRGRLVHSADRELRNLVTTTPRRDWNDIIDIWTPLVNCFIPKPGFEDFCNPMAERRSNLWWYQSCASHGCSIVGGEYFRGWPSYIIDSSAVANRVMPWMAWKYDIKGELYYNINEAYSHKSDAWWDVYLFGGNGDGTLVYPGRPRNIGGRTDIPVESIRLKLIREGLEDYEYLTLLSRYGGSAMTAAYVDSLITNAFTYQRDPAKLYDARQKIGDKLSNMTTDQ